MRFLADENFPGAAVDALRASGNDVVWVRSDAPGLADPDILAWAMSENRIILTFDKDFGELAYAIGLPAGCGIVLFRMPMPPPSRVGTTFSSLIGQRTDWAGHFSVVEVGRVRMRRLNT